MDNDKKFGGTLSNYYYERNNPQRNHKSRIIISRLVLPFPAKFFSKKRAKRTREGKEENLFPRMES